MTERAETRFSVRNLVDRIRYRGNSEPTAVATEAETADDDMYPVPPESHLGQINKRLAGVNFGTQEVRRSITRKLYIDFYSNYKYLDDLSRGSLELLAESTRESDAAGRVAEALTVSEKNLGSEMVNELEILNEKTRKNKELKQKFADYLRTGFNEPDPDSNEDTSRSAVLASRLVAACRTFSNERLFSLFGNDINKYSEFIQKHEQTYGAKSYSEKAVTIIDSENSGILLSGVKPESVFSVGQNSLSNILAKPEFAQLFNGYFKTDMTWADRIVMFKKVLALKNIVSPDGVEKADILLNKIARDENERNPWISSGLAPTTGWEIEYSNKTDAVRGLNSQGVYSLLSAAGFKRGGGMPGTDEASPGPFYSYQTSLAVFSLYHDAGIIDPESTLGMTCHFNLGKLPTRDTMELVPLIRSLYLTGAAYDPHYDDGHNYLLINNNTNYETKENYIESKVFDVTTTPDTLWNLKASSVLSVAFKAYLDLEKTGKSTIYRQELASIWSEYLRNIHEGLAYGGHQDYLFEFRNAKTDEKTPVEDVAWVDNQLKRIWKDPEYYEVPILDRVGQTDRDTKNTDGIEGLQVGDKWYPNIACFARQKTEEAMAKILAVKNRFDTNCTNDIRRIDSLNGHKRRRGLKRFVEFYNVRIDGDAEDFEEMEKAFAEIKKVMLSEEKE